MTRSTFKTLFYINRSKEKKNGSCPIMGRITIDGKQVQYSTGKEIAPELGTVVKGGARERAKKQRKSTATCKPKRNKPKANTKN